MDIEKIGVSATTGNIEPSKESPTCIDGRTPADKEQKKLGEDALVVSEIQIFNVDPTNPEQMVALRQLAQPELVDGFDSSQAKNPINLNPTVSSVKSQQIAGRVLRGDETATPIVIGFLSEQEKLRRK